MKSVYALVSYHSNPVFITAPKVVAIYESAKDAKQEAKRRNESKRTRNEYWCERVPFIQSGVNHD